MKWDTWWGDGGGYILSQYVSSLSLTIWEDSVLMVFPQRITDLTNQLMTKVFVEQPWLSCVCLKLHPHAQDAKVTIDQLNVRRNYPEHLDHPDHPNCIEALITDYATDIMENTKKYLINHEIAYQN